MKKYVQTQKEKPFDWFKALSKNCNKMTREEASLLDDKSFSWVTCACGNQCEIIPRESDGAPVDDELKSLGGSFHDDGVMLMYNRIRDAYDCDDNELKKGLFKDANRFRLKALHILSQIEKRSSKLIKIEANEYIKKLKVLGYKVSTK